jgi:hypothetical protein
MQGRLIEQRPWLPRESGDEEKSLALTPPPSIERILVLPDMIPPLYGWARGSKVDAVCPENSSLAGAKATEMT